MEFNGIMTSLVAIDSATSKLKPSLEATYGPYASIDAAYAAIVEAFESDGIPVGLTVGIQTGSNIVNYWFNGGIAKANLVKKYPEGGSGGGYTLFTTPSVAEDSTTYLNTNFADAVKGDHVVDTTSGHVYIKYSDTGWTKLVGTILAVAIAPKSATMYYGSTYVDGSEGARQFVNTTAAEIMALNTYTAKTITGVDETTFVIHQTDNVHYLLIPTEEMELIHAEHGTVLVSTLWDKTTQDGAYKQPYDAGVYDGKNYTKWFLYSPGGAFADDIRITVKNL